MENVLDLYTDKGRIDFVVEINFILKKYVVECAKYLLDHHMYSRSEIIFNDYSLSCRIKEGDEIKKIDFKLIKYVTPYWERKENQFRHFHFKLSINDKKSGMYFYSPSSSVLWDFYRTDGLVHIEQILGEKEVRDLFKSSLLKWYELCSVDFEKELEFPKAVITILNSIPKDEFKPKFNFKKKEEL